MSSDLDIIKVPSSTADKIIKDQPETYKSILFRMYCIVVMSKGKVKGGDVVCGDALHGQFMLIAERIMKSAGAGN